MTTPVIDRWISLYLYAYGYSNQMIKYIRTLSVNFHWNAHGMCSGFRNETFCHMKCSTRNVSCCVILCRRSLKNVNVKTHIQGWIHDFFPGGGGGGCGTILSLQAKKKKLKVLTPYWNKLTSTYKIENSMRSYPICCGMGGGGEGGGSMCPFCPPLPSANAHWSYSHILFKSPLVEGRSTRPTSEGQHSPLADRHPLPVPPDPGLRDPAEGQGAPDGDESGGVGGAQEGGGGGDQGEPEAPQEDGGDRRGRRRGETGH